MDLSQMSDQELEAFVNQGIDSVAPSPPQQSGPDFSSMSDDDLMAFVNQGQGGSKSGTSQAQTALEGFGKGATFGYLPHIQAMTEPLIDRAMNLLPGPDAEPAPWAQMNPTTPEYVRARDANIKRQRAQSEANPMTAGVGELAGVVTTSAIPGLGAARAAKAGSIAGMTKSGLMGAGQAAAMNPGDVEGEVNPLQLPERFENAKTGAMFGAGGAAIGKGLQSAAPKLKKAAEQLAFKSSGAMLKDFRQVAAKGEVEKIGRFMLDKGIIKAGDSVDDVAVKAAEINQSAGQALEEVYSVAGQVMKKGAGKIPKKLQGMSPSEFAKAKKGNLAKRWQDMSPSEFSRIKNLGFNPVRDKGKIISQVKKALGDDTDAKTAVAKVEMYLDDLIEKYGDEILSPKQANDIKSAVDRAINYARNPLSKEPGAEKAYKATRTFLSKKIDKHIDFLGNEIGDPNAAKALKAANQDYYYSKRIEQIAQDRANRADANNFFGLPDYIVGSGMTAGGAAIGGLPGAAAGLAATAASKAARKYGTGVAATGADAASRIAGRVAPIPGKASAPTMRMLLSPGFAPDPTMQYLDEYLMGQGGK